MKTKADIVALIACVTWASIGWSFSDRGLIALIPIVIAGTIVVAALISRHLRRWFEIEAATAIIALMAVLPFYIVNSGGV